MGDLNYRVDLNAAHNTHAEESASHQAVLNLIDMKAWDKLLKADQLNMCKAAGEAFEGFSEGKIDFAPTFKVLRQPGTQYKDQRIPSFCDRVLWKSMPPLRDFITLTSFTSLPAVSTSDHKPVLATFTVRPTDSAAREGAQTTSSIMAATKSMVRLRRSPVGTMNIAPWRHPSAFAPLIRIDSLELSYLRDMDSLLIGGGSDPYCIFFTNPPGLLSDEKHAPRTTIKKNVGRSGISQKVGTSMNLTKGINFSDVTYVTPSALLTYVTPSAPGGSPAQGGSAPASSKVTTWRQSELPLLRPQVADNISILLYTTLIIVVMDHDVGSSDDVIGVVHVPLAPKEASGSPAGTIPQEYCVSIEQNLVSGNVSKNIGYVKGSFTISHGDMLHPALGRAEVEGAGKVISNKGHRCHMSCDLL